MFWFENLGEFIGNYFPWILPRWSISGFGFRIILLSHWEGSFRFILT